MLVLYAARVQSNIIIIIIIIINYKRCTLGTIYYCIKENSYKKRADTWDQ